MSKARLSGNILQSQPHLRALVQRAKLISQLQQVLQQCLPVAAAPHCHLGDFNQGRLTLIIDNAHWATRLRYQQAQLLRRLREHIEFAAVEYIDLKVRPHQDFNQDTNKATERRAISSQARQTIQACADGVSNERLRTALERLAQNTDS